MLSIVTPATTTNLTTLNRARAMLSFTTADEATVAILIEQASQAIVDYCRRPFARETVRETFEGPTRSGGVLLGRSAVTEILSVTELGETIPLDEVRHDPDSNMLFRVGADSWHLCWLDEIAVTYTAGYVLPSDDSAGTLPSSVERAAIRLIGAFLSMNGRDSLIKSETIEGVGQTSWWVPGAGAAMADPEAQQLLDGYRRLF
jgi:hypothetical protein